MKNKLNSCLRLLAVMILTGVIFGTNLLNANAEAAKSITLDSAEDLQGYVAGTYFTVKKTTSNEYVYCVDITKKTAQNTTATLVGEKDAGFAYIMENGYPRKSFTGDYRKDYYITQTAVWWYIDEIQGTSNLSSGFKSTGSDPYKLRPYIKNLVEGAKKARANGYAKTSISTNVSNTSMKLSSDSKYYVSESITVTSSNISTYKVTIANAPSGTIITDASGKEKSTFEKSEKFIVKVPATKVTNTTENIKINVSATGTVNKVYEYKPKIDNQQNVIPTVLIPTNENVSSTVNLNVESSKVTVIKLDKATNKALAGATLVIKDSNGKQVGQTWVSTTKEHVIRNLPNGTYTVEEVSAPKGYKTLKEGVKFTVSEKSQNITVKIYNEAKTNVVTITKLDGETGNVLEGAVLLVKDSSGKEIARFETGKESKVLTDLPDGTYTVEEVSAPAGYKKCDDVIKFTFDDEHSSFQVNFNNYPEVVVPNTASNSSIIMIVIGLLLVGSTAGFVYKNAKQK